MLLELEQKTWGPQRWSGFILWEMIISVQNIKHGCRSKQAMGKQIRRQNGEWSSVVIALACQLKLAMFHSVLRRRKNARIIMLAAKGYMRRWWCSNSWSLMWVERSPCQSLFGKSFSIQRFGRQRQKTPQTFLQIIGRFFLAVSITFLMQYPSKWAEKFFMETWLLWLPSLKPWCGATNRNHGSAVNCFHPFLAMSQWDSWGTPCTMSCVFWWSLERTS